VGDDQRMKSARQEEGPFLREFWCKNLVLRVRVRELEGRVKCVEGDLTRCLGRVSAFFP